nr:MAG TPA: hypothetical protein [Caudoviricetes sp.]
MLRRDRCLKEVCFSNQNQNWHQHQKSVISIVCPQMFLDIISTKKGLKSCLDHQG